MSQNGQTNNVAWCHGGSACLAGVVAGDLIWIAGQQFTVCSGSCNGVALTSSQAPLLGPYLTTAPAKPVKAIKWGKGYDWVVSFGAGHVGDQPIVEVVPRNGWQGPNVVLYVVEETRGEQPLAGTFILGYADPNTGVMDRTPPLPYDVSPAALKDALERLKTISVVDVTQSVNGYGLDWQITFSGTTGPAGLLSVDTSQLTGPSAAASVARTRTGTMPTAYGSFTQTGV